MNVFYDFEIADAPYKRKLSPLVKTLTEELRMFIEGRLSVFADTMKKQEEFFGSRVEIRILSPQPGLFFNNYAPSLVKKMVTVFSDTDMDYINKKLSDICGSFLN